MEQAAVFDKETGEIILNVADVSGLADMGKWLVKLKYRAEHLSRGYPNCTCDDCNAWNEMERARAIVEMRMNKVIEQQEQLVARAEYLVTGAGEKRVGFPGFGAFRFRQMPEKVDASVYEAMSDAEKLHVQNERKGYFTKKTTITPDKKAIKAQLELVAKGESDVNIDGFKVVRPNDRFEFVPER